MEAFVNVFCDCGWILQPGNLLDLVYCENPRCKQRAKLFRVTAHIEEVKEIQNVSSNNGNARVC